MKIFAFRFGISFEVQQDPAGFQFESRPWAEVANFLLEKGPIFPNQVFYTLAENNADFADRVYELHTQEALQEQKAEVVILFPDGKSRDAFAEAYIGRFKKKEAAGGLVMTPDQQLLLIERHGLWDLPKGKLEKGETIEEGAWREVAEECGIDQHTIKEVLSPTYHIFKRRKKWRFKPTYWYWMEIDAPVPLTPQGEESITQAIWMPLSELRENMPDTYPTIEAAIRELIYKSVE